MWFDPVLCMCCRYVSWNDWYGLIRLKVNMDSLWVSFSNKFSVFVVVVVVVVVVVFVAVVVLFPGTLR